MYWIILLFAKNKSGQLRPCDKWKWIEMKVERHQMICNWCCVGYRPRCITINWSVFIFESKKFDQSNGRISFLNRKKRYFGKKYLRSSMAAILLFLDNSISLKNYSKAIIGKSNGPIYPENEFRLQVQLNWNSYMFE